jgi:hypothetical protein
MMERWLPFYNFEPDHIRPEKFGGSASDDNLAWSCLSCNRHKGPLVGGHDPDSLELVRLFHPRQDTWEDHFAYDSPYIVGLTAIGRTTVWALGMNSGEYVELRQTLGSLFKP